MRPPRLGEFVAGVLRTRILEGELAPGSSLPRQEDLIAEFQVSPPSVREALRILESEGLITVLRGNVGGGIVHAPPVRTAAFTIAMVLQARNVNLSDVAVALQQIEPICASMCAARPDRHETLVPTLRQIHQETLDAVDDIEFVSQVARRFHEAIVDGCGSETITVLAGALEAIWTAHATDLAARASRPSELPLRDHLYSRDALANYAEAHKAILDAVDAGDAAAAGRAAADHVTVATQQEPENDQPVLAFLLGRDSFGREYGARRT